MPTRNTDPSIDELLKDAWAKVEPILRQDPAELARRLARRHKGILRNIPRAWCIAIRANDRRIDGWTSSLVPERPVWWDEDTHRWRYEPHEVDLEYQNLVWLCRPRTIPSPGMDATAVAEMLGVSLNRIEYWVRRGWFKEVKRYPGFRRGQPGPVVFAPDRIDPQATVLGRMGHRLWGTQGAYLTHSIPRDLCQTVVRRPVFVPWRGEMKFRGWRWVCPVCGRRVRRIYYPLPCHLTASFVKPLELWDLSPQERERRFACKQCHRVRDFASDTRNAWNHVISHLSGGLLYGREVKRPASFVIARRNRYYTKPGARPAKRQAQIAQLLVNTDLTRGQIAERLGIGIGGHVSALYRRHNVHRREELRKLLLPPGAAAG